VADADAPTAAILGASPDPARYAYQAVLAYLRQGWTVWPVHPRAAAVAEQPTYASVDELPGRPAIVSLYLRPAIATPLLPAIAQCRPDWLWCNPGADDPALIAAARAEGLRPIVACNLVALSLGDPRTQAERWWHTQGGDA